MTDARLPHSVPALHRWNSIHGGRGDAAMKVQAFADRPQRPDEHDGIEYGLFLRKLWRRKLLLLAITVMGTGVAAAIIMRLPPHFVAHAYVSIGDPIARNRAATGVNQALGMAFPDTGTVKTEVEVLKSPQLALEVIRDLHLADDPEFNPALESNVPPGLIARLAQQLTGSSPPANVQAEAAMDLSRTIDNVLRRQRIEVKEASRMVDVAFDAPDRQLATRVANAIVDRYVNNQIALRSQSAVKNTAWLQERIAELQGRVEAAETAVEKFRSQAGLFSTPGGSPLLLKQMTDTSAELAVARSARAAIEARLSQLNAANQAKGRPVSELVDSPFMKTLDTQEADAVEKLAEASASMGAKHPVTIGLAERLRHIRSAKINEGLRAVATLGNDLKIASLKEQDLNERLRHLQDDVARMNSSEVTLRKLERDAQADRLVLNNFLARFKESSQESDVGRPDAQIVSYAQLPVEPERPKKGLLLAICGVLSFMVGAAAVHLLEKADQTIKGLQDLEGLGIAGLGLVPFSRAAQLSPAEAARFGSTYREAVKAIYSRIFWGGDAPPQVTVVTSSLPSEGKTNLALGLTALASQSGQRVLLIDADLWKKGASSALDILGGSGLAEVLEGKATMASSIITDVATGADILLPGEFSRGSFVSWINRLPALLNSLRRQYDVIIVDTPPICSVAEATLLACWGDTTVLAVRCGKTPREALKLALRKLAEAGAAPAGAVLTLVKEQHQDSYGYGEAKYLARSTEAYRAPSGSATWLPTDGTLPAQFASLRNKAVAAAIDIAADGVVPRRSRTAAVAVAKAFRAVHGRLAALTNLVPPPADSPKPANALVADAPTVNEPNDGSPGYAIVILGIQQDFTSPSRWYSLPQVALDGVIHRINAASRLAARFDAPVLYARQEPDSATGKAVFRLLARDHTADDSRHGVHTRLEAVPGFRFSTPAGDAFSNDEFDTFLRRQGIGHLFLAGIDGATSIARTARTAIALGYRVSFIRDGIFTAFERKWDRQLKAFEASAAFAISSEEFGEFAATVQRAKETRSRVELGSRTEAGTRIN